MIFLDALHNKNQASHPPCWLMRQAGRYMPEYRALREKHSFLDMVKTPELAAKVTELPITQFEMDAAILFADILIITDALGYPVHFEETVGPVFEKKIETVEAIETLSFSPPQETLPYIQQTIQLLKPRLKIPLIGFAGAPFTVACYLLEGKTSKEFSITKKWLYRNPEAFHKLLSKLTDLTIKYLEMQIDAGVDAVQLFDSWAHIVSPDHFTTFIAPYHKRIIDAVQKKNVPIITFCRGCAGSIKTWAATHPNAISVDWSCSLSEIRRSVAPGIALQGNLDPSVLYGTPDTIRREVRRLVSSMKGDHGYIFNLGHGVFPDISPDAVRTLVEAVKCH
jgi:uroporphyrinogen decarboxylase